MALQLCLCLAAILSTIASEPARIDIAPERFTNSARSEGFTLLELRETGIGFSNTLSLRRASENQILLNGSGVAAGDIDGDGRCDLYFCSLEGANKLYRNLGNCRFADFTSEAGLERTGQLSTGAVFADLDGDGDLDLLVNGIGRGTSCFLNDGAGHFKQHQASGLRPSGGSTSLALADVDGDGDLDIYVVNYRPDTIRSTGFPTVTVGGRRMFPPEYRDRLEITAQGLVLEHGEPDVLYLNDGHGSFRDASEDGRFSDEAGIKLRALPRDWGLSGMFYDVNGDRSPDLYVCNDFHSPDRFWLNDGKGFFRAAQALSLRSTPTFSMSLDFADVNRDGIVDLFAADMLEPNPRDRLCQLSGAEESRVGQGSDRVQIERNTLQLGRGDCTFEEVSHFYGLNASHWTWGVAFLDVDLDGFEDLLVSCGNLFNTQDRDANEKIERGGPYSREMIPKKLLMYPPLQEPKLACRNLGGARFENVSNKWGFDQVGIGNGMCLADLDNDGDMDVIVNNLNGPAGIYRNESRAARVAVRLKGNNGNTAGIGAKIELHGGAVPLQSQEMICGGRYLSGDDSMRVFAAGAATNQMRLVVTWRDGKQTAIENVHPNSIYTVAQAIATEQPRRETPRKSPLFEDASQVLAHEHHEEAFDDFARQGLLPKKFSQLGPGVTWVDLNHDGRDDLIIGSGRGAPLTIFENHGKFVRLTNALTSQKTLRDQTTILPIPSPKSAQLIVGTSNYEDVRTNGAPFQQYDFASGRIDTIVGDGQSSTGPLALADIDGDGSLELFVGGRIKPVRYPEPASSLIMKLRDNKWSVDQKNSAILQNVGLVSGAVWTDLNRDGYPELVLACEWGPVKIFANDRGALRDATREWGMNQRIGWWNGVSAGDFDGDGNMDLIASNWGSNTKHQVRNGHGPRIYFSNWGGAGEVEPLEAVFDDTVTKWIPERDLNSVGASIPFIREKFQTHRAYAEAGVDLILGDRLKEAVILEANWLETTVFLNRSNHFELGKLPVAAQFTPAFGVNIADFDGDANEDVFLSQNFFAVHPQATRNDSGRGILLKGDGRGAFERVDGSQSGIKVYGEQRGSAVADYDGDGRPDLVVTQNGAATMLFHNVGGKPGLRVRLKGAEGNPEAFGAIVRLGFSGRWGPAREIHGGSGYWSQDSVVQVLALPSTPDRIQVLWPGGQRFEGNCPENAREITVDKQTSQVMVVR